MELGVEPTVANFLKKMWRRKVVQFGVVYLGAAWLLLQVAVVIEQTLNLPDWIDQTVLVILLLGFPVALILAWAQSSRSSDAKDFIEHGQSSTSLGGAPTRHKGLIETPAIVTLPFQALTSGAEESQIVEGITSDITTQLNRFSGMTVIPRQAVTSATGIDDDPMAVARGMDAQYAITGSVRGSANRIRVAAELTDLRTNEQVWADRRDYPSDDLLEIEDNVSKFIVGSIRTLITVVEGMRNIKEPEKKLGPWQLSNRALAGFAKEYCEKSFRDSLRFNKRALDLDPDSGISHSLVAHAHGGLVMNGWTKDKEADKGATRKHAERAYLLDPDNVSVIHFCSEAYWSIGDPEDAILIIERTLKRIPDLFSLWPILLATYGAVLARTGQAEEGKTLIEKFASEWPNDVVMKYSRAHLGYADLVLENYESAAKDLAEPLANYAGLCRVIALVKLGKMDQAKIEYDKIIAREPDYPLDYFIEAFKDFHQDEAVGVELSGALVDFKAELEMAVAAPTV